MRLTLRTGRRDGAAAGAGTETRQTAVQTGSGEGSARQPAGLASQFQRLVRGFTCGLAARGSFFITLRGGLRRSRVTAACCHCGGGGGGVFAFRLPAAAPPPQSLITLAALRSAHNAPLRVVLLQRPAHADKLSPMVLCCRRGPPAPERPSGSARLPAPGCHECVIHSTFLSIQ